MCVTAGALPSAPRGSDNRLARHVLALSQQTGVRLAEVGFLLILFAGIWLAVSQVPQFRFATARTIVAGIALAVAGLLLIVATHSGGFG